MKDNVQNIGIVGLGFIAEYHCNGARLAAPGARILGMDLSREAGRRFVNLGLIDTALDSLDDLIAANPDVVHVLTPPNHHGDVAAQLLDAGIDVLVEKPLAHSVEECAAVRGAAESTGALVGVSHNQLFYPKWESARQAISDGELGTITSVDVVSRNPLAFLRADDVRPWMMRASSNILFEVAPHSFAQALDVQSGIEVFGVRTGSPQVLGNGVEFFRHWDILASAGDVAVRFSLAFDDGFGESTIAVRGSLGSLTMDFNRNTLATQFRTFASTDLEIFEQSISSARSLTAGAATTLAGTVAGKAGAKRFDNPWSASIVRSIQAYYENRRNRVVDHRHSVEFGSAVVRLAEAVAQKSGVDRTPSAHRPPVPARIGPSRAPRVTVLGGTGFIGAHLVRVLSATEPVRVLARNPAAAQAQFEGLDVEVIGADAQDTDEVMRHIEPGMIVYHLAFSGGSTWAELESGDVVPTIALADACAELGIGRFVYTSSIAGYDASKRGATITEETPFSSGVLRVAPYARAKAVVEDHLNEMFQRNGFPVVICRPGIVLGAESDPVHWGVASWRHPNVCLHWGSGNNPLPIVLVDDVADAMARMGTVPGVDGETFNLSAPGCISAEEYLAEVARASGSPIRRRQSSSSGQYVSALAKWALKLPSRSRTPFPSLADIAGRSLASPFDCSKAEQMLDWHPVSDREQLVLRGITEPAIAWTR